MSINRRNFLFGSAAATSFAGCATAKGIRPPKFRPVELPGLEPKPDFWKVRASEVMEICERAAKCSRKEIICRTPLGYPVYALFYGDFSEPPPQTNWSAGSSSRTYRSYFGDRTDGKQTFLFLAGVHGAEQECVAGALNLIQLLETGTDFRGKANPELVDLISKYRLIVCPCVNMDGRSISPDHLRGLDFAQFRAVSQGTWKNGELIGWRGSKCWFPLPLDQVAYPGGYPNADGFNIMHDACPGHIRTAEARALLQLAERWRVDALLNGHSYEYAPSVLLPDMGNAPVNVDRLLDIRLRANRALHRAGLQLREPTRGEPRPGSINLNTMFAYASGALALTLECSVSFDRPLRPPSAQPTKQYSFEELMDPVFIVLREYLKDGLERPFLARGDERVKGD